MFCHSEYYTRALRPNGGECMPYHINADEVSLDDLKKRLQKTDLVPSRAALMNDLAGKINILKSHGIKTLAGLRFAVKTPKRLESLTGKAGIDREYLVLLRREIESYFPKPYLLMKFTWLPLEEIEIFEKDGIRDTATFYESFIGEETRIKPAGSARVNKEVFKELLCLCDLVRIQWTSPTAARMYVQAGYVSAHNVASANAEAFCNDLMRINEGDRYFKGKIGLRDVKRLIHSAGYLKSTTPQ